MARNIPKALATFVSSDSDTARMYSHIQAAVQPLLDFVNKNFPAGKTGQALNASGAVQLTQSLLANGTMRAPSLAFTNNTQLGWYYDQANDRMVLVANNAAIAYVSASGVTFALPISTSGIANTGAFSSTGTVTSTAIGTPSFVSAQGFKSVIPAGEYWASNTAGSGSWISMVKAIVPTAQNSTASFMSNMWISTHPGSITGMSVYAPSPPPSGSLSFRLYVDSGSSNYQTQAQISISAGINKQVAVFNKGTLPFSASSYVYMQVLSTAASANVYCQGWITVELGA